MALVSEDTTRFSSTTGKPVMRYSQQCPLYKTNWLRRLLALDRFHDWTYEGEW